MKTLTDHQTNDCNNAITITCDAPDEKYGNASHSYLCRWKENDNCPYSTEIKFQRGPIGEVGVNGLTNEVLLAIVIDRLRGFQSGAFACRDNALALTKVEEALMWLANRTRGRVARGVEGTNVV